MNKFFRVCHYCHGAKIVATNDNTEWTEDGDPVKTAECGECDGNGIHPTDEGFEVIEFLKRLGIE